MSDSTEVLEAQAEQRASARRATFEALKGKKRAEREVSFALAEGEDPVSLLFRAIGITDYDKLVTDNPPTKEQLATGAGYNINKFGPALLSKVIAEPPLTVAEWAELWNSQEWSGGEISQLFSIALDLCGRGLNLAPTEAD